MSVFNASIVSAQQLDWAILRDGGIALYWQTEVLADDIKWFQSNGYVIVDFETADWKTEEQMHDALNASLSFPHYYGNNLDALNECISEDLSVPDETGLVLILRHYDQFQRVVQLDRSDGQGIAEIVLHIFARAVRYHMLFGRRLLILVQSDDPHIRFDKLAPVSAGWNRREWLNKNRGL